MAKVTLSSVNRRIFFVLEVSQAIECLRAGLERIAEGHNVLHADSATLFLLANGLERYLKTSFLALYHHANGDFADGAMMRSYSHGILTVAQEVLRLESATARRSIQEREDLVFVQNDPLLKALLVCLDSFARRERYFLLNGVSGEMVDPELDPRESWNKVLGEAAELVDYVDPVHAVTVVSPRLIACVQRYLRCIAQTIHGSVNRDMTALTSEMGKFIGIRDEDLKTPIRP